MADGKSSLRQLYGFFGAGCAGLLILGVGCTVEVNHSSGSGGSSGGGSSSGGKATTSGGATASGGASDGGASDGGATDGGAASEGGATAEGGAGGAGGSGPVVECDGQTTAGTPAASCTFDAADATACHTCLSGACCTAVKECFGTSPYNQCAFGGPGGNSEFTCYEDCMVARVKANGGDYAAADEDACIAACATPECGLLVGNATADLATCMRVSCEKQCFIDPAM